MSILFYYDSIFFLGWHIGVSLSIGFWQSLRLHFHWYHGFFWLRILVILTSRIQKTIEGSICQKIEIQIDSIIKTSNFQYTDQPAL